MKIAVFNTKGYEQDTFSKLNTHHILEFITESLNETNVNYAHGHEAVSVFTNDDVSAKNLESLHQIGVRSVLLRCAGFNNVDLGKAKELGMKVANVPEYSPHSVAEFVVTLVQALNRNIIRGQEKVKQYNFTLDDLIGFDLNTKTIGIVGLGKIGQTTAQIFSKGFGCYVLGTDQEDRPELVESGIIDRQVDFEELLGKADIISLHVPLNKHTKYLINRETIAKMKDGVMIINTSRGAVVNTQDVVEGIKSKKIGALGIDVYEKEHDLFFYDRSNEILQDDLFARLLTFKNVLVTDHQGFLTETALENIMSMTLKNADQYEKKELCDNELVSY